MHSSNEDTDIISFLSSGGMRIEDFYLIDNGNSEYLVCFYLDGRAMHMLIERDDFHDRVVNYLLKIKPPTKKNVVQ